MPDYNMPLNEQRPNGFTPAMKDQKYSGILKLAPWAVVVFTAVLFSRALFNDFAVLDDDLYVVNNPFIRDFSWHGIKTIFSIFYAGFYHPLIMLTYLFEFKLYGLHPFPYHLLNVLLHLANTWLVYIISEKLSGKKVTALVTSLLFAIHPMHVESVVWVTERKDVMFTLFYLLALLSYLRYIRSGYRIKHFIVVAVFFLFSVLSKAAAVTLPVLLVAIDFYSGRKLSKRSLLEKVPLLLLAVFFGILAVIAQKEAGAVNDLSTYYSYTDRIFLFTYALAFYIVKVVAPFSLSAMQYYPVLAGDTLPWVYYVSLPFILLLVWLVIKLNSRRREVLFGVFFFLITISVMLQIIPVGKTITMERFSYVPYIGLFYLTGQWISDIGKKSAKRFAVMFLSIFIVFFSFLSWERIGIWKNGLILFNDVVEKYPAIYDGYLMRGIVENSKKDLPGALRDYCRSLELNSGISETYNNRGWVYFQLDSMKLALQDYNRAIQLDSTYSEAYNNRGMIFFAWGNIDSAMLDYNKAIALNPIFAKAYNNRGQACARMREWKKAMLDYDKALTCNPGLAEAFNNRSALKSDLGDLYGALEDANKAIDYSDDNADYYCTRGYIKTKLNDYKGAMKDYTASLKLKPNSSKVYFFRGVTSLNMNDRTAACGDLKKAMELGDKDAASLLSKFCQ
jgi:protein O-mannosyl-transferase